jgi:hypothetical protein
MSTSAQSTAPTEQSPERTLFLKIRNIDFEFRDQIKARIQSMSKQAGGDALDFLLHPDKTTSEQSALSADAHSDALAEALHRYLASFQHCCDATGALNTVRGIAKTLQSLGEFQRGEAETHALKELTSAPSEVADGRLRKLALKSLYRAEGTFEFVQLLRNAFASVLQDSVAPAN